MNRVWMKRLSAPLLIAFGAASSGTAAAATLNDIYRVADQINGQARQSQARIDTLTEETRSLLNDYKTVLKEIEGLRVYNRQLERQIENQGKEITQISSSIEEVTVIERQIGPLMARMVDALEQFVQLDLPFLEKERTERIAMLRETLDRADVAVSEKLSQVLRAYQIENEYGRTMESYGATIDVAGTERKVEVLKVGRVALVYQSPDGEEIGRFNPSSRQWESLDDAYKTPIRNAIRMANKQLSVDLIEIPVQGAEAAQ